QHLLLNHLNELGEDTISALFNQITGENPNIPQSAFASFMDRELGGLIDLGLVQIAREARESQRYSLVTICPNEPEAEWPVSNWIEYNSLKQSWQLVGFEEGTPLVFVVLTDKGQKAFLKFNDLIMTSKIRK
ncbi:MAG: hypothetical protein GY760_27015, partial [Deltaproteobacteria bacterium]|nr:hypothetical protein [Deltaproteobacteria bacterium]